MDGIWSCKLNMNMGHTRATYGLPELENEWKYSSVLCIIWAELQKKNSCGKDMGPNCWFIRSGWDLAEFWLSPAVVHNHRQTCGPDQAHPSLRSVSQRMGTISDLRITSAHARTELFFLPYKECADLMREYEGYCDYYSFEVFKPYVDVYNSDWCALSHVQLL